LTTETAQDLCPNCGAWVTELNERTGFCSNCSTDRDKSDGLCVGKNGACGLPVDGTHKYCWSCRYEHWLLDNGDAIERYMAVGKTFVQSKELVRRDNESRLNCFSCGEEMKAASNGTSYFCTKTVRCRTAHRRLKYLMYDRPRLPKQTALDKVMEELN
jgi:hypothetical protein